MIDRGQSCCERGPWLRRFLSWMGYAGLLGVAAAAIAEDAHGAARSAARSALDARVMAVRVGIQEADANGATADAEDVPVGTVAQWFNWPNWNNWNNWPNWGNWGNWSNWFNR
jgi:hypothetical protein